MLYINNILFCSRKIQPHLCYLLSYGGLHRTITELEAQLNYERAKREKLEAKIDQLNTKIHLLNKQLDDVTNKYYELLKVK